MTTTTNFSVRMDSDLKKQCEALYGKLGVNLTTAINVFLRQSLRAGAFPFDESGAYILKDVHSRDDFAEYDASVL